jgi:hypothetical protein
VFGFSSGGSLNPKYNSNKSSREGSRKGPEQRRQVDVLTGAQRSQINAEHALQCRHDCAHRSGSFFAIGLPPGTIESEIHLGQLAHVKTGIILIRTENDSGSSQNHEGVPPRASP